MAPICASCENRRKNPFPWFPSAQGAQPAGFRKLDEEQLRDVIRASLNAVYSFAPGEAFRGKGKTDICIEAGNRSAFVAECKIWRGEGELLKAVDQLLGYLTWRDAKTALIVFNKEVRNFKALREKVRSTIEEHGAYKSTLRDDAVSGEWRFVLATDSGTDVSCHVMVYHLGPAT